MSQSVQVFTDHIIASKVKGSRWRPAAADIWTYALTFGPGLLLLAVIGLQTRVHILLMKDPLAVVPLTQSCCHFYYGFISNLGVMLWTAAAAV